MKQPLSIRDLINLLNQNKEIIEMLFGNKDSVNKSEILAREDMSDEKLEKLVVHEFIHENNNIVSLDDRITTFIEEFLEIGEVTTSFINDNIQSLNENLRYYRIDNNARFLRNIKRSLKKIHSTTSREVIKLHKNIDDTYKNQANYLIKLEELEKYKKKRDDIINLIRESELILSESRGFFNAIVDAELSSIVLELRYTLVRNRDYLTEIQSQIIDYINRIQHQAAIYKKIQRLKELKDYEELKYKTNFVEVASSINAVLFSKKPVTRVRISLDYLYTDQGYHLVSKVADRLKLLRSIERSPAGKIAPLDEEAEEISPRLDVEALVEKFVQSDMDLFNFVLDFEFPDQLEISLEKRISLFVEISVDHDPRLRMAGERFGHTRLKNEQGQSRNIRYLMIYPAEKR